MGPLGPFSYLSAVMLVGTQLSVAVCDELTRTRLGSACLAAASSWAPQGMRLAGREPNVLCRPSFEALPLRPMWRDLRRSLPVLELSAALRLHGGVTGTGGAVSAPRQRARTLESLKTPLAFLGWYLMSIVYSILNKEVLTVWRFPCIFAAVQLLVGSLWVALMWAPLPTFGLRKARYAPLRAPPRLKRSDLAALSRVAVWLALGHVLSTVAPAYGTVAFTNVVKTLEPLFTCLFSAVFLRQIFSARVYLSLLPVIAGVAVASASEVSFSLTSLVAGMLSNVCFALRAISAKRLMAEPVGENMHAQNLYAVLTMLSLGAILPGALLAEGGTIVAGTAATVQAVGLGRFARMILLCGLSHYVYNECAFVALSSIHPVSHAVANTIKRVAVIVVSVLWFNNPLTATGAAGSAVAILGVLLYSLAKQ